MLQMMKDSAHDSLHIYRVLYQALAIAESYSEINRDVLIASVCFMISAGLLNLGIRHCVTRLKAVKWPIVL